MSPFMHAGDIASVSKLKPEFEPGTEHPGEEKVHSGGARVVFRAVRGLTVEWLQRVVDCHVARNVSLGHQVPEMPYCPLVPRGVTAKVHSLGNAFAVDMTSQDRASC